MGVSRCGTYLFATYKKIRCAIYSGQLSAGEKIPSVREMVKKREDTAKVLCFSYFDNMFALGFSKDEAIRFIQDYSERLKILVLCQDLVQVKMRNFSSF